MLTTMTNKTVQRILDLPDDLIKASDLASILNVGTVTLYDWADESIIPYIRFNKCTVRFPRDEVAAWVEKNYQAVSEKHVERWLENRGLAPSTEEVKAIWELLDKMRED